MYKITVKQGTRKGEDFLEISAESASGEKWNTTTVDRNAEYLFDLFDLSRILTGTTNEYEHGIFSECTYFYYGAKKFNMNNLPLKGKNAEETCHNIRTRIDIVREWVASIDRETEASIEI